MDRKIASPLVDLDCTPEDLKVIRRLRGHLYESIRRNELTLQSATELQQLMDTESLRHWRTVMFSLQVYGKLDSAHSGIQ